MTEQSQTTTAATTPARSILDLTIDELRTVVETNNFPPDVSLEGLERREDFTKLFRLRHNPKGLAKRLLKTAGVPEEAPVAKPSEPRSYSTSYQGTIPLEVRQERLELKKRELKLQEAKIVKQTEIWQKVQSIYDEMLEVKRVLNVLVKLLTKGGAK